MSLTGEFDMGHSGGRRPELARRRGCRPSDATAGPGQGLGRTLSETFDWLEKCGVSTSVRRR